MIKYVRRSATFIVIFICAACVGQNSGGYGGGTPVTMNSPLFGNINLGQVGQNRYGPTLKSSSSCFEIGSIERRYKDPNRRMSLVVPLQRNGSFCFNFDRYPDVSYVLKTNSQVSLRWVKEASGQSIPADRMYSWRRGGYYYTFVFPPSYKENARIQILTGNSHPTYWQVKRIATKSIQQYAFGNSVHDALLGRSINSGIGASSGSPLGGLLGGALKERYGDTFKYPRGDRNIDFIVNKLIKEEYGNRHNMNSKKSFALVLSHEIYDDELMSK